ncbi:Hypothetical protein CINCED_3A025912 [Cinara cedri]|uniref:Uncharacterized protein n=1 Tax=Cinara cedri TaxID=506608 RepID=A0A5E4NLI0_9HEMI|nr:Hypothetical protein CINCED_3A025912 [Cinara cedri]
MLYVVNKCSSSSDAYPIPNVGGLSGGLLFATRNNADEQFPNHNLRFGSHDDLLLPDNFNACNPSGIFGILLYKYIIITQMLRFWFLGGDINQSSGFHTVDKHKELVASHDTINAKLIIKMNLS